VAVTDTTVELGPVGVDSEVVGRERVRAAAREALSPELMDELMEKVRSDGVELLGDGGLVSELTKRILERAIAEELTDHVGYEIGDRAGHGSGNSRNGTTPKRVLTEIGAVDLDVPRDRDGSFEPKIVPKGVTRLARFNENIIALYAGGMSTRDIRKTLKRMYSVEVSPDLISRVTDGVIDELKEWQARPLDAVYPIMYIDALVVKVRTSGVVINRPAYLAVGVDVDGRKHVLGVWLGDGGEGAKFWLSVLTQLRNRGVEDVIFCCCDGLKGLPEAIEATWPRASVQTCGASDPRQPAVLRLEGPPQDRRRLEADLHRGQRGGSRGRDGHLRARARRTSPGGGGHMAFRVGAVHPVPGLSGGHPQNSVHHKHGRISQLSNEESIENARPFP
jgi:putative transposase